MFGLPHCFHLVSQSCSAAKRNWAEMSFLNASCSHTKHTHAPNYVRRWRRRCQLHTSATATQHTQCAMHKQTHTKKRALLYAPEDMPGERGRRTGTLGTQLAVGKSWADLSHTVLSTSANPAIRTTPRTPHRGARSHQGTRTNADAPRRTPFQRPPCGAQGCAAELAEQSSPSSILLPAALSVLSTRCGSTSL